MSKGLFLEKKKKIENYLLWIIVQQYILCNYSEEFAVIDNFLKFSNIISKV